MRLILGSQSPRRKEILSFFSYPFEQLSPHFAEELVPYTGDPVAYVETLSKGKADSLAHKFPKAVILAADTMVYKEGKMLGKPENEEAAFEMLTELNGSWHTVYSAVTAQAGDHAITLTEETRVQFHEVHDHELARYHRAFKSTDKAGGYGIQLGGSVIVKRIEGCFYNVMGLPLSATCQVLKRQGIDLWHFLS